MSDARELLVPGGRLRAAINYSNTVLARRDPATGEAKGIVGDLSRRLALWLGVPVEFQAFESAGDSVRAVAEESADIGFVAVDPKREEVLVFSQPYCVLEGTYLLPKGVEISDIGDADREGLSIAAVEGSAYGLHLTRTLRRARLVSCADAGEAMGLLADGSVDLVAGVRQMLEADARQHLGWHVMPGHFMQIRQAMCIPRAREAAAPLLEEFVAEVTANGLLS